MTEIEKLLEGTCFPDAETREKVFARVRAAIPQWLPIESAPKDGKDELLILDSKGEMFVAYYAESQWIFYRKNNYRGYVDRPVAWQPLPAPKEKT